MYPIMSTGNTVIQSVKVLKEHGVKEECIILSNLFCTPAAVQTVMKSFPKVKIQQISHQITLTVRVSLQLKILTSEVHPVAPNHFGQKYFGTD